MSESIAYLDALRSREDRAVVATLVGTKGSTPKRAGATMWVGESGSVLGSVTIGGCVDSRVLEESDDVLRGEGARRISMSLSDEEAWDLGMTCGGVVDLLLEPVGLEDEEDPVVRGYEEVREALERGWRAVAAAPLEGRPARIVIREDGKSFGTLGEEVLEQAVRDAALEVLEAGESTIRTVWVGDREREIFFEFHFPPTTLLVFGAGSVAIPLASIGAEVGWRVVVVDNRERFANPERFPDADEIRVGMVSEIAGSFEYTPATVVVVVAHDYKYEVPVLSTVLEGDPGYVGVLGSRGRGRALLDFLAESGVDATRLDTVRVPVGLDLGAESAAEIAVSIVAEILAVRSGRPGTPLASGKRIV